MLLWVFFLVLFHYLVVSRYGRLEFSCFPSHFHQTHTLLTPLLIFSIEQFYCSFTWINIECLHHYNYANVLRDESRNKLWIISIHAELCFIYIIIFFFFKCIFGLPWWLSGKESACQCRRHGFDPWSGKILHAREQLSLWATTTEPVLCNEKPAHSTWRVASAQHNWRNVYAATET